MSDLVLPRRKFLLGLVGLVAAPAIVRIASIMPVRSWVDLPAVDYGIWAPRWDADERRFKMTKIKDIPIQMFGPTQLAREEAAILAEVERAFGSDIERNNGIIDS